jgi:hypothetical protein
MVCNCGCRVSCDDRMCRHLQQQSPQVEKLLDFRGEPKTGPRNSEDAQGEKQQQGKGKKKDKGKMKMSKGSEDNAKKTDATKEKKLISCWICAKEHYVKNCPLKQKLNALEKEDNPYVGVLQVLNVVMEGESMESQEQDETKLFYVQAELNGKSVLAMVDSGVTHNFLREDMVQRLGLQPEPTQTTFKTVNAGVERVVGVAKDISLKLGDWCGKTSFTIVPMDDFEVVLGQEFMRKEKETLIPHMNKFGHFLRTRLHV